VNTVTYYGFTEEELDFIINYDIEYRMGKELVFRNQKFEMKYTGNESMEKRHSAFVIN
jgi:hypothetical protein